MKSSKHDRACCPGGFKLRIALLAGVLAILPFFLKRKARVVRRIFIRTKPDEIFPLLNDLRNWPAWTEWSRRDEIRFEYSGPPSGAGATQRWSTGCMDGEMIIIQSVENEQMAYTLEMNHGDYRMDGLIALDSIADVTRVTWLCRWDSGPNPYLRYRDLFMKWRVGRDFELALQNLKILVEEGPQRAKVKNGEAN